MNTQKFFIGLLAVACVALGGLYFSVKNTVTPVQQYAGSGQTQSSRGVFQDNIVVGGYDFATSSQGTVTYTATSIVNSRVIEHIAVGATTGTLPTNAALSSAGFLPNIGDTQTLYIQASTTKITLAGNTGVRLDTASTSADISPGRIGKIEFVRLGATEGRLIHALLIAD